MQYKQDDNRVYVLSDNNKEIAEMTFTRIGMNKATIDHTFVDPVYRGKGIADKLLDLVVERLRKEQREIIPLCSFAIKKINQKSHN